MQNDINNLISSECNDKAETSGGSSVWTVPEGIASQILECPL